MSKENMIGTLIVAAFLAIAGIGITAGIMSDKELSTQAEPNALRRPAYAAARAQQDIARELKRLNDFLEQQNK